MSSEPDATAAAPLSATQLAERRGRLPSLGLVLGWFALAHVALLVAALMVAAEPELLAATFYHPHLLAAAHLLTVGWISGSILGALHVVPALAMRSRVPRRRADGVACGLFAVATAALAGGLWWVDPHAVLAGAALAVAAVVWVGARTLPPILDAPVPRPVRLAFVTAFAAFAAAAALGALRAYGAAGPLAGLAHFGATFAHAHLAAIGWAFLVVLGAGYRLLPMLLPAAMPPPRRTALSVGAAAAGALLLAAGLLSTRAPLALAGGTAALAGIALFLRDAVWMVRHRRPAPPARPRPDLPLVHVAAALVALAAAAGCGAVLLLAGAAAPPGLRAAYGVLGLLGFFGQLVAGVAQRLVAWVAWLQAWTDTGFSELPPTPYALVPRRLQRGALAGWLLAVPALALGAGLGVPLLVRAGALALLAGIVAGGVALAATARRARRGR